MITKVCILACRGRELCKSGCLGLENKHNLCRFVAYLVEGFLSSPGDLLDNAFEPCLPDCFDAQGTRMGKNERISAMDASRAPSWPSAPFNQKCLISSNRTLVEVVCARLNANMSSQCLRLHLELRRSCLHHLNT